eukprot:SAG25_NODE_14528_length_254_cov_0.638710_1_plen_74_part_01
MHLTFYEQNMVVTLRDLLGLQLACFLSWREQLLHDVVGRHVAHRELNIGAFMHCQLVNLLCSSPRHSLTVRVCW